MNGIILNEGMSLWDGEPIVAILTGISRPSSNPKTGDMLQVWILRSDMHPVEALKTGADQSICGNCPHRLDEDNHRTCYVNIMAPSAIWRTYKAGKYGILTDDSVVRAWSSSSSRSRFIGQSLDSIVRGRAVRIGAYGDPAMLPAHYWLNWFKSAGITTGYTHMWDHIDPEYAKFCMASVDSEEEREKAQELGYRTFRVLDKHEYPEAGNEIPCPASAEQGYSTTCNRCGLCDGSRADHSNRIPSITITVHGVGAKYFRIGDSPKEQGKETFIGKKESGLLD